MTSPKLDHALERTVLIRAPQRIVFRYFTDSARWASWWGAGSSIDPRPGGAVRIVYPNAVKAGGEVVAIDPPRRIVFTMGFESGEPIPIGASRVTVQLADDPAGTRLTLRHEFAEAAMRDEFVQGWRYQLALFANVVSNEVQADAARVIAAWFAAWSEPDAAKRSTLLSQSVTPEIRFRDRYSQVDGLADLEPHLAAVHVHMPGHRLEMTGSHRQCQGTALADWVAYGPGGKEVSRGTNVFTLSAEGKVTDVVGLWG